MLSQPAVTRRTLAVLVLLCAVVCAQAASLASEELHHHSSQHCCGLCHTGPMPFVQSSATGVMNPASSMAWLESAPSLDTPHETPVTTGASRAPPIQSSLF